MMTRFPHRSIFDSPPRCEFCGVSWQTLVRQMKRRMGDCEARLDQRVEVCASCKRASCWQGEFYCDAAKTSATVKLEIRELRTLGLESPEYWEPRAGVRPAEAPDHER